MSTDSAVLLDAARMLKAAARIIEHLAKATQYTPEYEHKRLTEARANIDAALARIHT